MQWEQGGLTANGHEGLSEIMKMSSTQIVKACTTLNLLKPLNCRLKTGELCEYKLYLEETLNANGVIRIVEI